jgi:hypothetical protein
LEHHQQQQHHSTKVEASSTSALGWKYSARRWHLNNISTRLEIFSMKLASQKHQHEARNIHHEDGITTTLARGWKSSA